MTSKTREQIYKLHRKLYSYIKENPSNRGYDLLKEFEELLLNNDLLIGSKKELKDKLKIDIQTEERGKTFITGLIVRRKLMNEYVIDENNFKELVKNDFIELLENDWLNKML